MKDLESITQEYHFYILLPILKYQFTYQFLSLNRYFQWERFHQGQKAELWRGLELAAWWSPAHSHCSAYRILDRISLVSNITCYRSKSRFLFYTIMFLFQERNVCKMAQCSLCVYISFQFYLESTYWYIMNLHL